MRDFNKPGRSGVFATNGMCATSHPLAAQVAIETLKSGGNAVDAAIAGAVLLGICEPHMTGLGGDCFVLLKRAGSEEVVGLNGSGKAPARSDAQALRNRGDKTIGETSVESVTIPGAIDAFCHLAETEGRLGIDRILAPTIHYAEEGVPVAPRVAFDWQSLTPTLNSTAKQFYLVNGKAPKAGQVFRAPGQAEVLRRIARSGRAGFYEGEVADDIISSLQAIGGVHTAEDMFNNAPLPTTPLSGDYKGHELVEHPPNGQGATAILLLNILSHFDLEKLDPLGPERLHLETEASKLAYDARDRFIADPEQAATEKMLDPETAKQLAGLIRPDSTIQMVSRVTEAVHRDTVYICVTDKDGMSVSLIYSIFHSFGSGIASGKFGLLLQNRGCGFNLIPGHPNEFGGGKRPMHTIIPGMLKQNGRVVMPFGVMGGQFQPTGHVRFLTNHLDYGMDLQTAIDAPRAFWDNGTLFLEPTYGPDIASAMKSIGHKVDWRPAPLGGAQAIYRHESGVLEGASDPRKDGIALGY